MRHFFCVLIILNFLVSSALAEDLFIEAKYNESLKKISDGCLAVKVENNSRSFCNEYQDINSNISNYGQIYAEKIIKAIPYPTIAAFGSYLIKSLIDQKVVIDPHLKEWGNPKLEVKPNNTTLSISYDFK